MSTIDDKTAALLASPSLEALAYALRHPHTWPDGFRWDYRACETCAMGMAFELWRTIDGNDLPEIARGFHMSIDSAAQVFVHLAGPPPLDSTWQMKAAAITPEHVADAIDAYLATHPARTHNPQRT